MKIFIIFCHKILIDLLRLYDYKLTIDQIKNSLRKWNLFKFSAIYYKSYKLTQNIASIPPVVFRKEGEMALLVIEKKMLPAW